MFMTALDRKLVRRWLYEEDKGGAGGGSGNPDDDSGGGGGGGGGSDELPGYMGQFSGDLKTDEFFKEFKDLSSVGTALKERSTELETFKAQAENSILKPGDDATDEDKAAYKQALNEELGIVVPTDPVGYEFDKVVIPESLADIKDDLGLDNWAKVLHEHGVSKDTANGLIKAYLDGTVEQADKFALAQEEKIKGTLDALNEKWKGDAPARTENSKRALGIMAKHTDLSEADILDVVEGEFGNHPAVIALFDAVARKIGDDSLLDTGAGGGKGKGDERKFDQYGRAQFTNKVQK